MQQPEFARKDLKGRQGVVRAHIDQTFAKSSSDIPENEANAIKNFMISHLNFESPRRPIFGNLLEINQKSILRVTVLTSNLWSAFKSDVEYN